MTLQTHATLLPENISAASRTFSSSDSSIGDVDALFNRISRHIESAIAEAKAEEK